MGRFREYCDVFKTLAIGHADHHSPWLHIQTSSLGETTSARVINITDTTRHFGFHDSLAPPVHELLAKFVVLRL